MAFAKRECRLNADDQTKQLANDLSTQFGRGFGVVNLSQMRRFFLEWPTKGILQTPSEKSSTPIFINDVLRGSASIAVLAKQFWLPWSPQLSLALSRLLALPFCRAARFAGLFVEFDQSLSRFFDRVKRVRWYCVSSLDHALIS
jgi:hypothetical protein